MLITAFDDLSFIQLGPFDLFAWQLLWVSGLFVCQRFHEDKTLRPLPRLLHPLWLFSGKRPINYTADDVDGAFEGRVLRGSTSSISAALHPAGRAASERPASPAAQAAQVHSEKSQRSPGTESPDSFSNL